MDAQEKHSRDPSRSGNGEDRSALVGKIILFLIAAALPAVLILSMLFG